MILGRLSVRTYHWTMRTKGRFIAEGIRRALVNLSTTYQTIVTPWITGLYKLTDHIKA